MGESNENGGCEGMVRNGVTLLRKKGNKNYYKEKYASLSEEKRNEKRAKATARSKAIYHSLDEKGKEHRAAVNKRSWLKKKYGLTEQEYDFLKGAQARLCAICGIHEDASARRVLCLDHDHNSGNIRALLCHPCNVSLGLMKDSITNLEKMIDYLRKHNAQN